jgi:hypothetical protein
MSTPPHRWRVLIVEDDPLIGMLLSDMLQELGCEPEAMLRFNERVLGVTPSPRRASWPRSPHPPHRGAGVPVGQAFKIVVIVGTEEPFQRLLSDYGYFFRSPHDEGNPPQGLPG